MSESHAMSPATERSLTALLGKTDLLTTRSGRLVVKDKIEIPCNEFGLPLRERFIKDVLATVYAPHVWTGFYDMHHIVWERSRYQQIGSQEHPKLGSEFRGLATNQVDLRRQFHDYLHLVSLPLTPPDFGVMVQAVREGTDVTRLYDTVSRKNFDDAPWPEKEKEEKRRQNFMAKVAMMEPGWLGVMPDPAQLVDMTPDQIRSTLRPIARRKGLSNARRSHRAFFRGID